MAGCKLFESHWRPTLHCVGILVHGIAEIYYISNPDLPKSSNTQMTVLCSLYVIKAPVYSLSDVVHVCVFSKVFGVCGQVDVVGCWMARFS